MLKPKEITVRDTVAKAKVKRLARRKPVTSKVIASGKPLMISAGMQARFTSVIEHHVSHMVQEVQDKIAALYRSEASQTHQQLLKGGDETGLDASVGSQARILTNSFKKQFDSLFGSLSQTLAQGMVADANNNSKQQIKASTEEINRKTESLKLTLSAEQLDPATIEILKASVASATRFIQSIPQNYINKVTDAVMHSIQTGSGLQDLVPFLEKQGSTVRNWAHNTAMDQTRKTFNNLNRGRMQKIGVKRGSWLHSGGSQHPRPLHEDFDGQVFNLSDGAPVGDDGGNNVQPGEEPNCRCTFTPVIDDLFNADDDETQDAD